MFVFVFLARRICRKRDIKITSQWELNKNSGIKPGDYDYVWFDFADDERALIMKNDNHYILYVQKYDTHTGNWENTYGVSVLDSLEDVKKSLFFEYDFYCEENTEFDEYGDAILKF